MKTREFSLQRISKILSDIVFCFCLFFLLILIYIALVSQTTYQIIGGLLFAVFSILIYTAAFLSIFAFPVFLVVSILTLVFISIPLIYSSSLVVYSALRPATINPTIIVEAIPTEREEWKGIISELKHGWKILGMTEKQIYRKEVMLSINLAWGKF
jgi:hypothetical protein